MNKYLLVSAVSMLTLGQAHAERAETVIQQNSIVAKSAATSSAFLGNGNNPFTLNIPELQVDMMPNTTGVYKTGTVYHLPEPVTARQFNWERVTGGYVARIKLTSRQAKGLRFHLVFSQEIPSIKFRMHGNREMSVMDVLDHSVIHDNSVWLPVTDGNQAELEIFVDESTSPDSVFSIDAVNVIVVDLNNENPAGVQAKRVGLAQKPELDLACWANDKNYPALNLAANATARIDYIDGGISMWCTGTLLTDKKYTRTPWFATANHCLHDQATANTASFKWFYQATTCNGNTTDSRIKSTGGGAQLLWTDFKLEAAFLKLNNQPPSGVTFAGWDTEIHVNEEVWGVHHPKGDHTMVSRGNVSSLRQNIKYDEGIHFLNTINYIDGGIESGSSGSGLFSIVNGSAYWKGTLTGGDKTNYKNANYSDFNSYYQNIKQWLDGFSNADVDIDNLYKLYPSYFGGKSGNSYICYLQYTCQNFATGKMIGVNNSSRSVYWYDGKSWNQYR